MANSDLRSFVSGNLPDIAAITTLIGSATAESLTLGNRGASGLPWAVMSVFGTMSVVKACIAVATPSWMKDALGVRNAAAEAAVGLSLDLKSKYMDREDKARRSLGEPVGLSSQIKKTKKNLKDTDTEDSEDLILRDVYVFDQLTAHALYTLPPSKSTDPPRVHIFLKDPHYKGPVTNKDWIALLLSLVKLIELYTLWTLDARFLCVMAGIPWLYFFLAATIILQQQVPRGYKKDPGYGRLDIVAGQLPTSMKPGGDRRILLGVPQNFRQNMLWKVIWILGSVACILSLLGCYLFMRREQTVATVWILFQALWLVIRSFFFHLAEESNRNIQVVNASESWDKLTFGLKRRVKLLAVALSWYLKHNHPRESYMYNGDLLSLQEIQSVLPASPDGLHSNFPLSDHAKIVDGNLEVSILSVIGDTTLTSVAWFSGSSLTGMDLYDCCILFIDRHGDQPLQIPTMRVLANSSTLHLDPYSDEEKRMALLAIPKGAENWGMELVKWVYWVQCDDGRWLQLESLDGTILGKRQAKVLTSTQLAEMLAQKTLGISLTNVQEVEDTVRTSMVASKLLIEFMTK